MAAKKKEAFVGEQRLPYLDEGPRTGAGNDDVPILFLHGWGLAPWAYRGMLDALSCERRVVSPYLPALTWNRSIEPITSHQDWADMVARFCAAQDIGRAHIVGQSTGGGVAACLASRAPELAASLTVMDASGAPSQTPCNQSLPKLAGAVLLDIVRQLLDPRYPIAQARMAASFLINLAGARWQLVRAARMPLYEDLTADYQRLTVPVQVLSGGRAVLLPPGAAKHLQALVPGATLRLVERGFHLWEIQQPGLAADLILDFARHVEKRGLPS